MLVIGDTTTTARIKRKFAYDGALNAVSQAAWLRSRT
jgi:hypothetical protein